MELIETLKEFTDRGIGNWEDHDHWESEVSQFLARVFDKQTAKQFENLVDEDDFDATIGDQEGMLLGLACQNGEPIQSIFESFLAEADEIGEDEDSHTYWESKVARFIGHMHTAQAKRQFESLYDEDDLKRSIAAQKGNLRGLIINPPKSLPDRNVITPKKSSATKNAAITSKQSKCVFIVHGKNSGVRNEIELYITKELGLDTRVMQAGPHRGRSLPEKFEEIARECSFAVFIMTADDVLRINKSGKLIKRARQNVILEVGYFWGLLGRHGNVAFLVENDPDMELPSDIQGLGWIPITPDLGETKLQLHSEFRSAGLIK